MTTFCLRAIALEKPVIVVGDDTRLVILLLRHFVPDQHRHIYLQANSKLIDIHDIQINKYLDLFNMAGYSRKGALWRLLFSASPRKQIWKK